MKIEVSLSDGQKLEAKFGDFVVTSDQNKTVGGDESHPEPFDYFLVSLPLCAGFFARKFCEERGISTEGLKITQSHTSDEADKYKKHFVLDVALPPTFPEKYKKAIIAAVNTCSVKRVIQAQPEFEVNVRVQSQD
ncbi:OsmC family protein [Aestuariibacter sp. AA17]|uniref:OsmC family protein n=1 Tax=Fluctibacter corallii TaxID=2984329 RepID=A0ABT3A900_9ALTE|nr:OsmC family protein [Aestuariibacter sp. AA17]MCV2885158.1 OsmC family protein [Aestuariibacter sp. AA17]